MGTPCLRVLPRSLSCWRFESKPSINASDQLVSSHAGEVVWDHTEVVTSINTPRCVGRGDRFSRHRPLPGQALGMLALTLALIQT